jgi:2-polyprenyl-6-methoxyphenol hydroxylase-like FAD-dependent oxidoreductase
MTRCIIAGGGVGGLTAAVAMRKAGIEAIVLEQAPRLRAAGCGVHLWTNALLVLDDLGIGADVIARGAVQSRCEFEATDGTSLAMWPVGEFAERYGQPVMAVGRDDLIDTVACALGQNVVRRNSRVVGYDQHRDHVDVRLATGEVLRGDVLVGADGVNSSVRHQLLGPAPPDHTGEVAWRAAIPFMHEHITTDVFRCLLGTGTRFVIYPIGPGRVHWMSVAEQPPGGIDGPDLRDVLLERHRGWAEPVAELIKATPPATILRNDVVDRDPDAVWGEGRVTLLGDAAHPMSFHLGQGACQAIEDGVALTAALQTIDDPIQALRAYEAGRQMRTGFIQRMGRMFRQMGTTNHPAKMLRSADLRSSFEGPVFARLGQLVSAGARFGVA